VTPGTLLTVAPTGAESAKADVPALPVTVEEVAATARDCQAVGAAVVHLHVRDADTRPTLDLGRVREVVAAVRESSDLVVQLSSGGAVTDPFEARLAVLDAEPDAASLTLGTVNFGRDVFSNPWDLIVELHTQMQQRGIVPEYEVFDLGHLATLARLLDRYGPPHGGHVHVDLVMGVPGGMPGTAQALTACLPFLPEGATFAATGVGRTSLPVMLAALSAGGHLRVGMEDTLTYSPGEPVRDNVQLVARAAALARIAQRPPLDPAAARTLLGIGLTGRDDPENEHPENEHPQKQHPENEHPENEHPENERSLEAAP
jgi:3-keto-5-aminohexanoate cleavage enzyme